MKRLFQNLFLLLLLPVITLQTRAQDNRFTMEEVMSYPFTSELVASSSGSRIAWAVNESGLRNIYVAEGPGYTARRLTGYVRDEGQEISSVKISPDGKWVVYIRGGDHGSNWNDNVIVNAVEDPFPGTVEMWSIPFGGGSPVALGEGEDPVISPDSKTVAFVRSGQIWTVPVDGSSNATGLFRARGSNSSPVWSPGGNMIAFRSSRQDHSFIGIYSGENVPVRWIDPSFSRDSNPVWSPDGKNIVFIRQPGSGGAPDSMLAMRHRPWSLVTFSLESGKIDTCWKAPETIMGSPPNTHGGYNLHWAAGNRIVFMSYHDGWPHLYSIPSSGGDPLLLTPGNYMAEYVTMSHDGKYVAFAGNTGPLTTDIDRRHIVRVETATGKTDILTPGEGNEWAPCFSGDGSVLFFISATAARPPVPAAIALNNRKISLIGEDLIPGSFPVDKMVKPEQVIFRSADGTTVHATLFRPAGARGRNPAIVFLHGGPPRQMLLGWHYSSYYSNAYAVNQFLASQGFTVLSVNYRLGIGYGFNFHNPPDGGRRGASEYQDVVAGAEWLKEQSFVDPSRIGIYGGSYGGYLTALALARNSGIFRAGVDVSGVHDWSSYIPGPGSGYEPIPDYKAARDIAWRSSPVSSVGTWTSPVLIIHGDDDRNVDFNQSTDLVRRLSDNGVYHETLVIADDTHHFLVFANQVKVNKAIAGFFDRKLR